MVQRLTAAALGIALLLAGAGIVPIAAAYSAGAALGLAVGVVALRRAIGRHPLLRAPSGWAGVARASAGFATQDALNVLRFRADAVLLAVIPSSAAVGQYGAAYRLFEASTFITAAVTGAFNPMFVYLDDATEPTLGAAFERTLKLVVAALPCAVALAMLADGLCELMFGPGFDTAARVAEVLAPGVVLLGVVAVSTALVVSRRSARAVIPLAAAATAGNVVLNVILIPGEEAVGAAIAMVVAEAGFAIGAVVMAGRIVGGLRGLRVVSGPALAAAALALTLALLQDSLGPAIAAGAVVYLGALLAVERLLHPDDLRFAIALVRRPASSGRLT